MMKFLGKGRGCGGLQAMVAGGREQAAVAGWEKVNGEERKERKRKKLKKKKEISKKGKK